jgi:hypothetical protein
MFLLPRRSYAQIATMTTSRVIDEPTFAHILLWVALEAVVGVAWLGARVASVAQRVRGAHLAARAVGARHETAALGL